MLPLPLLQGLLGQERVAEAQVLLSMMRSGGLPVDVVMYNLLMTAYKKKRQWFAAHAVLQQMVQVRVHSPLRTTLLAQP